MNCLKNIIGLKEICEDTKYQCYTNISLKMWAKLAELPCTGKELFEQKRDEACEIVASDFIDALGSGYEWHNVIKSEINGGWDESNKNLKVIPIDQKVGRRIEKHCSDPYLSFEVPSICIYSKSDGKITIEVKEKFCEPTEIEYDLVCGKNFIEIDFKGDYVDIEFLTTTEICDAGSSCMCGTVCSCGSCYQISDIGDDTKCTPFQVCVNCICNPDTLVCKYKNHLKDALKWRLEALYWECFETTCRKNEVARNMIKQAQVQYDKIMGGATSDEFEKIGRKNSKYWPKIWSAAKRVKGSVKHSACIRCKGRRFVNAF